MPRGLRIRFRTLSLAAGVGSFAVTGNAADLNLRPPVILAANTGAFVLSGVAATLSRSTEAAAVARTDHRCVVCMDVNYPFNAQLPDADMSAYGGKAPGYGPIVHMFRDIPESGLQVDANHKSFEKVADPLGSGKTVFRFTIASDYPEIAPPIIPPPSNGEQYVIRITPGGQYTSRVTHGVECWVGFSLITDPSLWSTSFWMSIYGLHHVNVPGIGLTPGGMAILRDGSGNCRYNWLVRSTTSVNNGVWTPAPVDQGNAEAYTWSAQYGSFTGSQHHKFVANFRLGYLQSYNPFAKVWMKNGDTWENGGNPIFDFHHGPFGHNLTNQAHQMRGASLYNYDSREVWGPSWPPVNNIPTAGDKGYRLWNRGFIGLVAGAPNTGEPIINRDSIMAWLER